MMLFIGLVCFTLASAQLAATATDVELKNDWKEAYRNATDHWCHGVQIPIDNWNGKTTCRKVLKMYDNLKQCNDTSDLSDTNIILDSSDFELYNSENKTENDTNAWFYDADDSNNWNGVTALKYEMKNFVTFYSKLKVADVDKASADIAKYCYQRCEGAVVLGWGESQCSVAQGAYDSFKGCDGNVNKASLQKWFSEHGKLMKHLDTRIGLPADLKFDEFVPFSEFMLSKTDVEGNNDGNVSFEEFVKPFAGLRGTTKWGVKLLTFFSDNKLNEDCSATTAAPAESGVNTLVASTFMGLAFLL